MSTSVISDVHGNYNKYVTILNEVKFSDKDTLYIIGDLINRGADGIALIQDVMKRKSAHLIKGNHELMIQPALDELFNCDKHGEQSIIAEEVSLFPTSQNDTLQAFCQLNKNEQLKITDFLNELPLYKELDINSHKFLLVHAGLPDFSNMDISLYEDNELLFGNHDFSITHYENTTIVVEHTPTRYIKNWEEDKIYRESDSICIDCGLGLGGQLGVLCLETNAEFYF